MTALQDPCSDNQFPTEGLVGWQVYGMMEALVSKPAYLTKLEEAKLYTAGTPLTGSGGPATYPQIVFLNSDYWEAISEERPAMSSIESPLQAKAS